YAPAARAEAERRLGALEAGLEGWSDAAFELELARIVALADNGHTLAFPGPRSERYNRVPVRMVPFGDRFYGLRAAERCADLLGAELTAIDGRAIAEVRDVARTLAGGPPFRRDRFAPYFFESPELLHALGMSAGGDAAVYRFAASSGTVIERRLTGEP